MTLLATLGLTSIAFTAWFTWWTWRASGSAREAIVEAWINIVVGFAFNFCLNFALIPLMTEGGKITAGGNWWGGWCFTAASVLRQYVIRRWCHSNIQRFSVWLAAGFERCRAYLWSLA